MTTPTWLVWCVVVLGGYQWVRHTAPLLRPVLWRRWAKIHEQPAPRGYWAATIYGDQDKLIMQAWRAGKPLIWADGTTTKTPYEASRKLYELTRWVRHDELNAWEPEASTELPRVAP